jgi:hypothetical protein
MLKVGMMILVGKVGIIREMRQPVGTRCKKRLAAGAAYLSSISPNPQSRIANSTTGVDKIAII